MHQTSGGQNSASFVSFLMQKGFTVHVNLILMKSSGISLVHVRGLFSSTLSFFYAIEHSVIWNLEKTEGQISHVDAQLEVPKRNYLK